MVADMATRKSAVVRAVSREVGPAMGRRRGRSRSTPRIDDAAGEQDAPRGTLLDEEQERAVDPEGLGVGRARDRDDRTGRRGRLGALLVHLDEGLVGDEA